MYTGTRTQVADTARSGMPRILRLSSRSFCSSLVSSEPSSTSVPASGTTLKATGATNSVGTGKATADPSRASAAEPSAVFCTCSASSAMPAEPAPETAW